MTDDLKLTADEIRQLIRAGAQSIANSIVTDTHGSYDPMQELERLVQLARKLKDAD